MAIYPSEAYVTKSNKLVAIRSLSAAGTVSYAPYYRSIATESTHTYKLIGKEMPPAQLAEVWDRDLKDPFALRLGAFFEGQFIGQLLFYGGHPLDHPWTRHRARFGMGLIKEFWGEGIAQRLLEIMESHARSLGVIRIEAEVRAKNERGIKLYTRFGFEIEGTRKSASLINGVLEDEFYIAKILTEVQTFFGLNS